MLSVPCQALLYFPTVNKDKQTDGHHQSDCKDKTFWLLLHLFNKDIPSIPQEYLCQKAQKGFPWTICLTFLPTFARLTRKGQKHWDGSPRFVKWADSSSTRTTSKFESISDGRINCANAKSPCVFMVQMYNFSFGLWNLSPLLCRVSHYNGPPNLHKQKNRWREMNHTTCWIFNWNSAQNRNRTCTPCGTRTWNVRVYQFRHLGMYLNLKI